jgi:hypothetical protein
MLRQQLAVFNQLETQIVDHFQRFHVIAADFAGNVAVSAGNTLVDDVQHPVAVFAPAGQQRLSYQISSARRIAIEIIVSDARTPIGEPDTFDLVQGYPLAI